MYELPSVLHVLLEVSRAALRMSYLDVGLILVLPESRDRTPDIDMCVDGLYKWSVYSLIIFFGTNVTAQPLERGTGCRHVVSRDTRRDAGTSCAWSIDDTTLEVIVRVHPLPARPVRGCPRTSSISGPYSAMPILCG